MSTVAENASAATDREMTVRDASVCSDANDGVGIVEVSVVLTNLAGVDGDDLRVTEPFASGFTPEQHLVLNEPEGFEASETMPSPEQVGDGTL